VTYFRIEITEYREGNSMNSQSETMRNLFAQWVPLSKIGKDPKFIPDACGLYVFRKREGDFGRLVGKSDILYIGSSKCLRQRIVKNYLKGVGGKTTKRIHLNLIKRAYMEHIDLSFALKGEKEYEKFEKELREQYENEHHEFPPWNRAA